MIGLVGVFVLIGWIIFVVFVFGFGLFFLGSVGMRSLFGYNL